MKLKKKIKEILQVFQKDKRAQLFLQPVPWQEMGLLDYPKLIKNPMDLGTIESKIDKYSDPQQFIDDLNLVWNNCKTYNQEGSDIYRIAVYFQKETQKYKKQFQEEKKKKEQKLNDKLKKKQQQQQFQQQMQESNFDDGYQMQQQNYLKNKEIKYDQKIQLAFNLRNSNEDNLVEFLKLVLDNCDNTVKANKKAVNINLSHLDQDTANQALELFNQKQETGNQKKQSIQEE